MEKKYVVRNEFHNTKMEAFLEDSSDLQTL